MMMMMMMIVSISLILNPYEFTTALSGYNNKDQAQLISSELSERHPSHCRMPALLFVSTVRLCSVWLVSKTFLYVFQSPET